MASRGATVEWIRWVPKPMVVSRLFQEFRIDVRPSPETNDHEVRFCADGEDIIARFWNGMIGLDPDDILATPCPLDASVERQRVTVARCSCGVIECGSIEVAIARITHCIDWTWGNPDSPKVLRFPAISYDAELQRALTDSSWETPDRTAARLLAGQIDRQVLASRGLTFTWASGRLRKAFFSVSLNLEPGPYQILVHLPWQGESPEGIARKCAELLQEQPSNWFGAEWFPQQANLGPPSVVGPKWRRGGS